MQTMHMALLVIAVMTLQSFIASGRKVRNCSCQRNGNMYIQLAKDKCDKFAQYDNVTKLTYTHICPEGLKFSVKFCVCVHSSEVLCIGCGSPACEQVFDERFKDIFDFQKAGECERADQISKELLASCEIKDSISIALLTLRYATAYRKTPCPIYLAEDGCEEIFYCFSLLLTPERKENFNAEDNAPKLLCENYKESVRCLRCMESNGCQLAGEFRDNLMKAAVTLCPNIKEFTCLAVN